MQLWNKNGRLPVFGLTAVLLLVKMAMMRHWLYDNAVAAHLAADAGSIVALLSLFGLIATKRWRSVVYWAVNVILSVLLFAVTVYYAYYGSVPTYLALNAVDQVGQVKASVDALIRPQYYLYFVDVIILLAGFIYRKVRKRGEAAKAESHVPNHAKWLTMGLIAGIAVCFLYIRDNMDVANELVQSEQLGVLNYELTAAINEKREAMAVGGKTITQTKQDIRQLQQTYPYVMGKPGATGNEPESNGFGSAKGMNVIVIQLEAFQNFTIHLSVDGQTITPVLNKLIDESYYFPHVYQQIGPGNTSDAEFMSGTSIYPTGAIAMSTGYGDRKLPSFQRLLSSKGYVTNTFHVNDVTFWDRIKLYPALGYDKYYDKPYFNNDHFNDFGASDVELYRVGVEQLKKVQDSGKPFYAQFVTASSHFPFKVPKDQQRLVLPDEFTNTELGDYLQAINYTDYAIGKLIDSLKANGMWDNTMLVLYGDHFGVQKDIVSDQLVSSQLGIPYDSRVSRFNIPLIMHVPGGQGKQIETTGGQLDIMPTEASLLGISLEDENYTAFGHNLLGIDHNVFGMRYYLPTGSFFNDDIVFIPGKGFDDGTAISLDTLKPVDDITPYRSDYDYIMKLESLSDQYVKELPKRKDAGAEPAAEPVKQ
ncbi:LTA synthase family protein [Paenibacillus protaetiae]|uniref:LTA synthase family protein n=1 Tax=Paenibacillus protaetiae TaxID=2509456 RepID=A0A4P6EY20_9BACL|nr:LTA synthase family protein [Paenibacillus protaetiae]QAY67972.1 LTA synthase family protein [Paenibacillus protaetiae]